mgnify:CR=1 FL=1
MVAAMIYFWTDCIYEISLVSHHIPLILFYKIIVVATLILLHNTASILSFLGTHPSLLSPVNIIALPLSQEMVMILMRLQTVIRHYRVSLICINCSDIFDDLIWVSKDLFNVLLLNCFSSFRFEYLFWLWVKHTSS